MTIAALLARATRVHTHAQSLHPQRVLHGVFATQRGAGGSLVWRGSCALTSQLAYFSTFSRRGYKPPFVAKSRLPSNPTEIEDLRVRTTRFHAAVNKKTRHIDELAARGALDTILGVVYECYKPLYDTQKRTKPNQSVYDDAVTKRVELRAMEQFLAAERPDLVADVYSHRRSIKDSVGGKADGKVADSATHLKGFWQSAMSAFHALGDDANAVAVYEEALMSGLEPSGVMTSIYVTSRLARGDHKAMDTQSVPLREEEYGRAMRSLDDQYNFQARTIENYRDYLNRIAAHKTSPELHAQVYNACRQVLALFDEMVDVAKLQPDHKASYPRVMRAAMLLQDYERVTQCAELYERTFGTQMVDHSALAMRTNALLFRDEPEAAWNLALSANEDKDPTPPSLGLAASLTSTSQYLAERQDHALMIAFLDAVKAKRRLRAIGRDQRRILIEAAVLDTENVSDASILKIVRRYSVIFPVWSKIPSLDVFAKACVASGRWSLLLNTLNARDKSAIPTIPGRLVLSISEAAMEDESNAERMNVVAALVPMVKAGSVDEAKMELLQSNAARAIEAKRGLHADARLDKSDEEDEDALAARGRRETFRESVEECVRQLKALAASKRFDTMLRVVYGCYKPLYDTHSALQGVQCSLSSESYGDAQAAETNDAQFVVKTYNDPATRRIELKAMELFLTNERPDLAAAVYNHRMAMARELGTVTDEKSGYVTDFAKHYRYFSQLAMSTFQALGDHGKVVSIYEEALEIDMEPAPSMTSKCVFSLVALGEHDKVRMLYEAVKNGGRPADEYSYSAFLHFAGLVEDSTLAQDIYQTMKNQNMLIRQRDYLSAILSYGSQYFDPTLFENYQAHLDSIAAQVASPELYPQIHNDCKQVLALFDEMVNVANIKPDRHAFYPRLMHAAMLLQDYERVTQCAELYERTFGTQVGNTLLTMATNAWLLRGEPEAAWIFALKPLKTSVFDFQTPSSVRTAVTSIVQYLKSRQDLSLIGDFLGALKVKKCLPVLSREQRRILIDAIVLDTESVDDATILKMMGEYNEAFTEVSAFEDFAEACMTADRWPLLLQALKARSGKNAPRLPAQLALRISERALEDESSS